jgi:phosphoribosylamine--glycine ligase
MKILVIGSGGREHALVWKLKQSRLAKKIYCAPGNPGIAQEAICENIPAMDLKRLLNFATKKKIDLTIVGPEMPLAEGIVDLFEANGLPIFGPTQRAAELEGSKAFAKRIMERYKIPTADFRIFDFYEDAKKFVAEAEMPLVIKADGLAAGKGAIVCHDPEAALQALHLIMVERAFGEAGRKVVVEECLVGEEVSLLGISDGEHLAYLAPAQDHKAILDGDQGPNTGGMGAYAPTPMIDAEMLAYIKKNVMEPTIAGMALEDRPFRGVLYAGLMLTRQGPKVLEYNCRFGDPETQAILPLMEDDLLEVIMAAQDGQLKDFTLNNHSGAAVSVVIASGGYPDKYQIDKPILGLDITLEQNVVVFHAGTQMKEDRLVTAGGRVLGVTAMDKNIKLAIDKAYRAVRKITFDGAYYRKDIGAKALAYKS